MLKCQPPGPALKEPLVVSLLRREEPSRWRHQHHYLGLQPLVGQSLCHVATAGQDWVALLAWGSAALKCQPRDGWIGWPPALQWRRLHLIANNLRFLILPEWRQPNLASRLLALNLKPLSADWERFYRHPILVAETFVDPAPFQGTCYRAAGWKVLGTTRGFAKRGRGYVCHGQPKTVLVRPLSARAVSQLVAPFLPPLPPPWKGELTDGRCQPFTAGRRRGADGFTANRVGPAPASRGAPSRGHH